MFIEDMKVGMKVLPKRRTVLIRGEPESRSLQSSIAYQFAQQHPDPSKRYLIITKIDAGTGRALCAAEQHISQGDWFMELDLEEVSTQ